MKVRTPIAALALAAAAALVALPLLAGDAAASGSHQRHAGTPPAYDTAAERTITGKVAGLLTQGCACGGLHVKVETAEGALEVGLGPAAFLDELGAKLAVGDEIEVVGAKPKGEAPAGFLARTVKRGESTWELRDADGAPRWRAEVSACPMHRKPAAG